MSINKKRGSIALARQLCYDIAGATSEDDDISGSDYGSVDVAEILSAEVERLREALAQPKQEPVACRFCHDKKGCWAWQCYHCGEIDDVQQPTPPAAQPCPTCEALARTVMLDQTSHDTQRQPLTDKQILADETLRYYFGQNGGAGPVSRQGRKVVDAIEAAHGIGDKHGIFTTTG